VADRSASCLLLVVFDGRAPGERVEVVLEEALRGELPRRVRPRRRGGQLERPAETAGLVGAVDVTRDELQSGVAVGGAALVVDRHPARQLRPVLERVFLPLGAKLPPHAAAIVMVGVLVASVVRETPELSAVEPAPSAAPPSIRSATPKTRCWWAVTSSSKRPDLACPEPPQELGRIRIHP